MALIFGDNIPNDTTDEYNSEYRMREALASKIK